MRKLLTTTAILLMSATGAFAASETITGTYSVLYTPSVGNGPSINNAGAVAADHIHPLASPFSENLTVGSTYAQTDFFAVTPAGSCGSGCDQNKYHSDYLTANGTLTVTFTFDNNAALAGNQSTLPTYTSTAHYIADYSDESDSVTWTSTDPFLVNFTDGSVLSVDLINASDWTIVPDIKFYLKSGPTTVPEPSSVALVGAGLLGLGFVVARKRRKIMGKAV